MNYEEYKIETLALKTPKLKSEDKIRFVFISDTPEAEGWE